MKKTVLPLILLAACAAPSCGGGDQAGDFEVAVPVSVIEIAPGSIEEYVTATGTARAAQEARLAVETPGEYLLRFETPWDEPVERAVTVVPGREDTLEIQMNGGRGP